MHLLSERGQDAIAGILVVTERAAGRHAPNIFTKLDLAPSDAGCRRVLARNPDHRREPAC
jgi:hypothetical protein